MDLALVLHLPYAGSSAFILAPKFIYLFECKGVALGLLSMGRAFLHPEPALRFAF
ncbi:MAG: hypothetical protein PHC50_04570 [Candidatus Cloacimonetes bacterium]|nr:hypothetical protein [Candidatus Cloacimonadota bacterium]